MGWNVQVDAVIGLAANNAAQLRLSIEIFPCGLEVQQHSWVLSENLSRVNIPRDRKRKLSIKLS